MSEYSESSISITACYTEKSLSQEMSFNKANIQTCGDLRERIRCELDTHMRETWALGTSPLHPESSSILLVSDAQGMMSYPDSSLIKDHTGGRIYALVPCSAHPTSANEDSKSAFFDSSNLEEPLKNAKLLEKDGYNSSVRKERQQKADAKNPLQLAESKLKALEATKKKSDKVRSNATKASEIYADDLKMALEAAERRGKEALEAAERRGKEALEAAERRGKEALEAAERRGKEAERRGKEALGDTRNVMNTLTLSLLNLRQDMNPLYEIHFRAVLEQIQSLFEQCLTPLAVGKRNNVNSMNWRRRLDTAGTETSERIDHARNLLAGLACQYQDIIDSNDAMLVICQQISSIRLIGDERAHSFADNMVEPLRAAAARLITDPIQRNGMDTILISLSRAMHQASG